MKVLCVIDCQNDFVTGTLGTPEASLVIPKIAEKIHNLSKEDKVIFTKDTHFSQTYLDSREGKSLPVEHCLIGTDGWEIVPELKEFSNNENTITKMSFGSMCWDRLIQFTPWIQTEIEIVGVCTGICVISNALILRAIFPEMKITVDASCCACVTPESHKTALAAMKTCQIEIIGEEISDD